MGAGQEWREHEARFMGAWVGISEVLGSPLPEEMLIDRIRTIGWRDLFVCCANAHLGLRTRDNVPETSSTHQHAIDLISRWQLHPDDRTRQIGDFIARQSDRPIFHEQVLLLLQNLAICYGADEDRPISDHDMCLLVLAANDHLPLGAALAETAAQRAAIMFILQRSGSGEDPIQWFLRSLLIMETRAPHGPLADPAALSQLYEAAFGGRSLRDHFVLLAGPLLLASETWALGNAPPEIRDTFYAQTLVPPGAAKEFLESLTADRSTLRDELMKTGTRIPTTTGPLHRHPLVKLDDRRRTAVSPTALREQLRLGLWARLLRAAKQLHGDAEVWTRCFGYQLEAWCARAAEEGLGAHARSYDIYHADPLSPAEEIDDLVVARNGTVIWFSVKAQVVREEIARDSAATVAAEQWLEAFFFARGDKNRRSGVVRQLHARIQRLRKGEFEPRVARDARVLPVIVTFDVGEDQEHIYRWLDERCDEEGLLAGDEAQPITLCSVRELEVLFALGGSGIDIVALLHEKIEKERLSRLSVFLSRQSNQKLNCPRWLRSEFESISEEIRRRLFPQ